VREAKFAAQARKDLDERFRKCWRKASRDKPPELGWVREIREALGMSARQLALLAKMKGSPIARLEQAERLETIKLATLRKLGKALECDLVYALVPNRPLDRILRDRAFGMLLPEILVPATKLGMNLPTMIVSELVDNIIRDRKLLDRPHKLWNESQVWNNIMQEVLATLPRKTTPSPKPPAPQPPQRKTGECPGHLKHIEELWRAGKVEE
jgi:predicted DNA-binding mobile mystery protein A